MGSVVVVLTLFCAAGADRPDWTLNSDWQTSYSAKNGRWQHVQVVLRNGTGRYGRVGIITSTCYMPAVLHERGDVSPALVGEWRMNGSRGYFVFRQPKPDGSMDGYWGEFDAQGNPFVVLGTWDGTLTATYQPPKPLQPAVAVAPEVLPRIENAPAAPDFSQLPLAEAHFSDKPSVFDLRWVDNLNRNKVLVGAMSLATGMNVQTREGRKFVAAGSQFGTCFLIGKGVGLTAKHCVSGLDRPREIKVTFLHPNGTGHQTHVPASDPIHLPGIDAAIILFPDAGAPWPNQYLSLKEALDSNGQLTVPLTRTPIIVQYPLGQDWRMSMDGEFCRPRNDEEKGYIHYTSTTAEGASGAPVFGTEWQLLAVHAGSDKASNAGTPINSVVQSMKKLAGQDDRVRNIIAGLGL